MGVFMDKETSLKNAIKDAEEADEKLNQMRKAFNTDPEVATLNKEYSEMQKMFDALFKKRERIHERVAEKYLDSGNSPSYHPTFYGQRSNDTNIRQEFIQAIKEVAGSVSKLRNSDIEKIIRSLMEEDGKKAIANVNAEIAKLRDKETAVRARIEALEKEKLGEQTKKTQDLVNKACRLKEAQSPETALAKLRAKATSKESVDKIRQRAKEIRKEIDKQDKSPPK